MLDTINHYEWLSLPKDKNTVSEMLNLPEEVVSVLKENTSRKTSLYEINEVANLHDKKIINTQQAKELLQHNTYSVCNLSEILKDNHYSYDDLIEYVNRCAQYQNISHKQVLAELQFIFSTARYLGIKINKYPKDLKKEYERIKCIDLSFLKAQSKKEFYELYSGKDKDREKLTFKNDLYEIKPIKDVETYMLLLKSRKYYLESPENDVHLYAMLIDRQKDYIVSVMRLEPRIIKKEIKRYPKRIKNFLKTYIKYLETIGYR